MSFPSDAAGTRLSVLATEPESRPGRYGRPRIAKCQYPIAKVGSAAGKRPSADRADWQMANYSLIRRGEGCCLMPA